MIFPPWTFPAGFASWGVISCAITSRVADTGFASADIASSSPREGIFQDCTAPPEETALNTNPVIFTRPDPENAIAASGPDKISLIFRPGYL
jgi:hypothetical protein